MKKITLGRVIQWLMGTESSTIIRIGTDDGKGWLFANYSVADFWYDVLPVEYQYLLAREVIKMYEDCERNLITKQNGESPLKAALCIIVEGNENGLW